MYLKLLFIAVTTIIVVQETKSDFLENEKHFPSKKSQVVRIIKKRYANGKTSLLSKKFFKRINFRVCIREERNQKKNSKNPEKRRESKRLKELTLQEQSRFPWKKPR